MIQSYFTESQGVLREILNRSAVAYGPTPSETLDNFPGEKLCSPNSYFFYGGYWHSLTSRVFAFVPEGLVRNGTTAVLFNDALCPSVNIDEIVRQSRAAADWTYRNAEDFGGNAERVSVCGHSAGGHLTGMLLKTDWGKNYGFTSKFNKGIFACQRTF